MKNLHIDRPSPPGVRIVETDADGKALEISGEDMLSKVIPSDLTAFAICSLRELQARVIAGDVEARKELSYLDAILFHRVQAFKNLSPPYFQAAERKFREICPGAARIVRGKTGATMSQATRFAYFLHLILDDGRRRHGLCLPPFSKATYKSWLPEARAEFEKEFGPDFENRTYFAWYWRKGSQHERTQRGDVRKAIWKDIKQALGTIAPANPAEGGTKDG